MDASLEAPTVTLQTIAAFLRAPDVWPGAPNYTDFATIGEMQMANTCLPPGLVKQDCLSLSPPPGLESVGHQYSHRAMPWATTEADPLVSLFGEYVQLRSEVKHLESTAPRIPPKTLAPAQNTSDMNAPSKPPGIFEPSSTTTTTNTIASANGAALEQQPGGDETSKLRTVMSSAGCKVQWRVDGRKLRSTDKSIISPSFQTSSDNSFKLMLKPKSVGERKGQDCFRKARGQGFVELKLIEAAKPLPSFRFRISVGAEAKGEPIDHDFSQSSVCMVGTPDELFDFAQAVDPVSSSFLICLEVLPCDA